MFRIKKREIEIPFHAYGGAERYIFVSYSHTDSGLVYPILRELHYRGFNIWYDEGIEAGEEWPDVIAGKISRCDWFLLFVSPDSTRSKHVKQEITFANSNHRRMLPVYLKQTELNAGIDMILSVYQAVYGYNYKNKENELYNALADALSENGTEADSEVTVLTDGYSFGAMLSLEPGGDQKLPRFIRIPSYGRFTVGRFDVSVGTKQSDHEFSKDTKNISRRHAAFERDGDGYTVTDLNSKAGTWLNGRGIPPEVPHAVESGTVVSFGNAGADYLFEITPPATERPASGP